MYLMNQKLVAMRIAQAFLFFTSVTPLIFYRPIFQYYTAPKAFFLFAISEIIFILLLWRRHAHSSLKSIRGSIMITLSVFIATQLTAALLGEDSWNSLWSTPGRMTGVFLLIHLLGLFMTMRMLLRTAIEWRIFIMLNVIVGLIVSFLYWFPLFPALIEESNNGSTLGNSSVFGTYLLFLVGFTCFLIFDSKSSKLMHAVAWIGAAIFVLTLFATDAHASQISLIGGTILAASLALIRLAKRPIWRYIGHTLTMTLTVSTLLVGVMVFIPDSFVQKTFVEIGDPTRLVLWDMARQAIQERPLLGWGPENFSHVSLRFYNPCLGSQACGEGKWSDRAHNIILETLVGSGIIGLLAYLGVFAAAALSLWKCRFLEPSQEATTIVLTCLLAAYFIQNQTGFDSVVSLLCWVIVLAFIEWKTSDGNGTELLPISETNNLSSKRTRTLPVLATAMLPVGLWYFVIQPALGFQGLSSSVQAQTVEARLRAYERAVNVSQAGLPYRRSYMAHQTSSNLWYASRQSVGGEYAAVKAEIQMAKRALVDTIDRTSNYLRAYLMLARVYQVESRLIEPSAIEDAQVILEKAVTLNPNNPLPKWALASVLIERGKTYDAIAQTQTAFDLNPNDPKAHTLRLIAAKFALDDSLAQTFFQESLSQLPELTNDLQDIISMNPDVPLLEALNSFY